VLNCVLVTRHWMAGVDFHTELAPPVPPAVVPLPVPLLPHAVCATLLWKLKSSFAEKVIAGIAPAMQRGTDIMNFIPHIPVPPVPACLAAGIITSFSGSKSHYGVAKVKVGGTAVAVAILKIANVNLNCGDIAGPTGLVDAYNTVVAQMTPADIWGGHAAFAFDMTVQSAINFVFGKLPGGDLWKGLFQMLVGTPLGFSVNQKGQGTAGAWGRHFGYASDLLRSKAEQWAGDTPAAKATRDNMLKQLNKEHPLGSWDTDSDADTLSTLLAGRAEQF
jgi:hypothetical protein